MSKTPSPQKEETFHSARSRLIDAYALLENRLILALKKAGLPIKGDSVDAKLKALRGHLSVSLVTEQERIFERLSELGKIRADTVHGVMTLIDIDGTRFASFRNAKEAVLDVQRPAQISYANLKAIANELNSHSEQLANLPAKSPNPPSSPQPPSPGAAGGP